MNELPDRMFTKKNLRGDRLPPTLDASVLHLCRALISFVSICLTLFLNSLSSFIKNIKYNIEKSFSILFTWNKFFSYDIKKSPNAFLLNLVWLLTFSMERKQRLLSLLSLRLEGEETLKYRCVCWRRCGKV